MAKSKFAGQVGGGGGIDAVARAQLADKASKADLANLGSASPKGVYATLSALQTAFPTGATGIYLVTADGKWYYWSGSAWTAGGTYQTTGIGDRSLTKDKISLKSISINEVDFLEAGGKNLFNKDTSIQGFQLASWTAGYPLTANVDYYVSDYIKVLPNTAYKKKQTYATAFYDSSLTFISGVDGTSSLTTPANCAYIRISLYKTTLTTEQVELGTTSTAYESFKLSIPKLSIIKEATADYDRYPFQPTATLVTTNSSLDVKTEVKNAVKRVELYGADSSKKYTLGIVQRNFSTFGTGLYIGECNADGTYNKYVAVTTITNYAIPSGVTVFNVSESNSSGITAKVWIDWTQITDGNQYVINTFVSGGLDQRVINMPSDEVKITLPPSIPAVIGKEVNLYFENVILTDNLNNYSIDVTCTIGTQQNERWTCIPSSSGTNALTLTVYKNGVSVASASTNIIVKAATTGNGVNKKALFIGDSTTDAGKYTQELLNLFGASDVMDITLLGTRGTSPNLHEGRAGWKASDYVTQSSVTGVTNAFWNSTSSSFDFSYYMTQQGFTGVDLVGIHLGINDIFSYTNDDALNAEITNVLNRFDTMINSIKTYNAIIKIGVLVTIPPAKNQDAFGHDYQNGQTKWRYKRNNFLWMQALMNKYKGMEAQNIYLIPINTNLDTENNMATETVAVNSRNTKQVTRQSNGVHPADSGYYQMADVIYYWLKGQEI